MQGKHLYYDLCPPKRNFSDLFFNRMTHSYQLHLCFIFQLKVNQVGKLNGFNLR